MKLICFHVTEFMIRSFITEYEQEEGEGKLILRGARYLKVYPWQISNALRSQNLLDILECSFLTAHGIILKAHF